MTTFPPASSTAQPASDRAGRRARATAIVSLAFVLSGLPCAIRAQSTVFDDTFTDGERSRQSLPSSVAWYHGTTTAANFAVRNGALDLAIPGVPRALWAYFPVVSLKIGEAITFSFDFRFTGSMTSTGSGMRIGLCYTNGATPRMADASAAPTGPYQGYGSISFSTNTTGLLKRDGPAAPISTSTLIGSIGDDPTAIWRGFGTNGRSSPKASQINTPYTAVLKVTRTSADTAAVTSSFLGGGLGSSSTITVIDPSAVFINFDTVIISMVGETLDGNLIITRANLTLSSIATVATHPVTQSSSLGADALFSVAATGNPPPTIQWQRKAAGSAVWANLLEGGSYSGVASATLTVRNVTSAMEGDEFRSVLTNAAGEVTSEPAALYVAASRLANLSVLTSLANPGEDFTMGYVVGGAGTSGSKSILIRAVGPSLTPLGVVGALPDPRLELFAGAVRTGENDNWGGSAALSTAFSSVGAFAYVDASSRDAANLATITGRDNSVRVIAAVGSGAVLAELYDSTPIVGWTANTPRLVNVSVLKNIGPGLTAGFVVGGSIGKTVLVRAIGPTLGAAPFNVGNVVADPRLVLFAGPSRLDENDNWGATPALTAAFTAVGAFPLPATSRDAAIVATLQPGSYTIEVSGVGGTTGVALVEIYEVP